MGIDLIYASFSGNLKRQVINFSCSLIHSDRNVLAFASAVTMWNKPRARLFLNHFLYGGGKDLSVNTESLFEQDRGVRKTFNETVKSHLKQGRKGGNVSISQYTFTNSDWFVFAWRICDPMGNCPK